MKIAEEKTPEEKSKEVVPLSPPEAPQKGASGLAIASLVLGIVGVLVGWCCFLFLLSSVLAIIFGFVDKSAIGEGKSSPAGSGLDTAGIVLGFIGIGGYIIFVILYIFVIGLSYIPFLFRTQ